MGAAHRPGSCFAPWTTPLYAALWLAVVVQGWAPLLERDPVAWLHYPDTSAERISERDLELAEAIARDAGPARSLLERLYGPPEATRDWAIEMHRDLLARIESGALAPEEAPALRQRLAVLLLEAHGAAALPEVRALLEEDDLEPDDLAGTARSPALSPGWTLRARRALAAAWGDEPGRAEADRALAPRGDRWKWRSLALAGTNLALVAVGAVLLVLRIGRRGGDAGGVGAARAGLAPPPWPLADGVGVFIRGDFWNRLFFLFLQWLASVPWGSALLASAPGSLLQIWGSLFAALPLLWLVDRHLLAPAGLGFRAAFGGPGGSAAAVRGVGIALAAIAVDLVGTHAIGWAAWGAGVGSSWAEGFDEMLVWGTPVEAGLTVVDYVAWAPIFEELAFRGVLYLSLRRRLPALPAAAGSAAFFSLLHFYSLPGFAMTLWSGFVWALAFERSRSLLPGIGAHAVYNGLYVAGLMLLYR